MGKEKQRGRKAPTVISFSSAPQTGQQGGPMGSQCGHLPAPPPPARSPARIRRAVKAGSEHGPLTGCSGDSQVSNSDCLAQAWHLSTQSDSPFCSPVPTAPPPRRPPTPAALLLQLLQLDTPGGPRERRAVLPWPPMKCLPVPPSQLKVCVYNTHKED